MGKVIKGPKSVKSYFFWMDYMELRPAEKETIIILI